MDFNKLDQQLCDSFADRRLDNDERDELRALGSVLDLDQIRFMRNRAFVMVQEIVQDTNLTREDAVLALQWLRQIVKTLDLNAPARIEASAHFTPGDSCRDKIIALCLRAKHSIDVCVFTISDNRLSEALIGAHKRGVAVRIITDDDKQFDAGSDIDLLKGAHIPLRMDDSSHHMHHKFAVFDRQVLLNGSFNWTASASNYNAENLLTTDNPVLVTQFLAQFEKLWKAYNTK